MPVGKAYPENPRSLEMGSVKKCPFCGSKKLRKAGFTYDSKGKHQRYECKKCRRFTSKPKRRK